ncbi:hypothetical protein [Sphingobium sp. TCM1]|uniref:hypothetical protein n=1 Tax=Sphingobium sp. TCM1 TaxID=453246 RepID=UPI0007F3CEA8|nr:hypothetical protein [Sphingobium sp. TCM1]OAN58663.1 hypothetical protein A7Q26_13560 [Sphingobium sp. TCM1]
MTEAPTVFDPADKKCWITRGRPEHHAEQLARAWADFPDLPIEAPARDRMARIRERVAALRPLNDAIQEERERERKRRNFAFIERRAAAGAADTRDHVILQARTRHGYDWDEAVQCADGTVAALSGWEPRRSCRTPGGTNADPLERAYAQGFRDAGGCFDDPFDAARRAYAAAAAMPCEARSAPGQPVSRPPPSRWPLPTDAPRPTRWSRRLLIVGEATAADPGLDLPAMLQSRPGHQAMTAILALPGQGFRLWNSVCNAGTARALSPLPVLLADIDPDDLLVVAHGADLDWIDRHADLLPLCRTMERTRNSVIQQRGQLRMWLDRGLDAGETMAGGHICWTKIARGLSGRLGEFTARYAGPARPRGHHIVVELNEGTSATGFMTPQGEPLKPETIISNKAHLRKHMAAMLRRFASAVPHY